MTALTRPGGTLAVQDVDWVTRVCDPPHRLGPAGRRRRGAVAAQRHGRTARPQAARLLRDAGLLDVRVDVFARAFQPDHPYQTLLADRAELCRDALVDQDLITAGELDDCIGRVRAHVLAPDTVVVHPLLFQAWGRRPPQDPTA